MNIENLITQKPDEEFIADTGWQDGLDQNELDAAHAKMKNRCQSELERFAAVLGQPDFNEISDKALAAEIYFEAICLSGWKQDNGFIYLAYGQHDIKTPVFVSCGFKEM